MSDKKDRHKNDASPTLRSIATAEAHNTLHTMHSLFSNPKHSHAYNIYCLIQEALRRKDYRAAQTIAVTIFRVCNMEIPDEFARHLSDANSIYMLLEYYSNAIYDSIGEVPGVPAASYTYENIIPFPEAYTGPELERSECRLCLAMQIMYSKANGYM